MRHFNSRFGLVPLLLLGVLLVAACGSNTTIVVTNPQGTATGASSSTSVPTATPSGSLPTATATSSGGGPTSTPAPTSTSAPTYGDGTSSVFAHFAASSTIHTTSDNSSLDSTYLDNPNLNGHPGAKVYVTPNWSFHSSGTYDNHHVGVWYDSVVQRWAIYNEDRTQMPANAAFNVFTTSASSSQYFTVTASSGNILGDGVKTGVTSSTAVVLATHVYDPGGSGGSYHDHALGVYYTSGQWVIFNEDSATMASGESFFVMALSSGSSVTVGQVTSTNRAGDGFFLNDSGFNGNPNKLLFVMPNWTYNTNEVYDNSEMGVYYSSSQWLIFKENTATMPLNMAFNVFVQG